MRRFLTLAVSLLLLATGCAVTLKQQTLHLKRDWLEVRERVVIAHNEGKLDVVTVIEYVLTDEAFQQAYATLVDKVLSDGDVSEDEIQHLQNMINAWKDRVP